MSIQCSSLSIAVDDGPPCCLSFSPHQASDDLLAIGTTAKIAVKSCTIKQEDEPRSGRSLADLLAVEHVFAVIYQFANCISWSPAASTALGQYRFCASAHGKEEITVFSSTKTDSTIETLPGHKSAVNDLCIHPGDETLLASVGDDCVCKLWDLKQTQLRSEFRLGSPGMSVCWHEQEPMKLMVAEKGGCIRIYDVSSGSALQSLRCPAPPLHSADWAPSNSLVVGGVAGRSWYRWDLSQSSQPLETREIHTTPVSKFRWCVQSETLFASLSAAAQFKIQHLAHQKVPVSCDLGVAKDVAWHPRIPLVGVATNKRLKCWVIEP